MESETEIESLKQKFRDGISVAFQQNAEKLSLTELSLIANVISAAIARYRDKLTN